MSEFSLSDISIIHFSIAAFFWLLVAFVVVIRFQKKSEGTKFEKLVLYLFVYPFVICNWAFNMVILSVLFLDPADEWNEVTTKRMKRYKSDYTLLDTGMKKFRYAFAIRLCDFLSKHDMGHC